MSDASGTDQPTAPQAPSTSDAAAAAPPVAPRKKVATWVKVLAAVGAALVAVAASFTVRAIIEAASGPSKQQVIEQAVEDALEAFDPPQQLDQVTYITDVTAEQDAIHYFYELVDVDPAAVNAEALEGVVGPGLCAQKATRDVLEQDIAMRYTYVVVDTGDTYHLEFTKDYC